MQQAPRAGQRPGGEQKPLGERVWLTFRWFLPFFAALLPIILLSVLSFRATALFAQNPGQLADIRLSVAHAGIILTSVTVVLIMGLARMTAKNEQLLEKVSAIAEIVESSNDAIIGQSLDGTVKTWNRGAHVLLGWAAQEVVGRPLFFLSPEDHVRQLDRIMAQARSGTKVKRFETLWKRKQGDTVAISLTASPVLDSEGAVIGLSVIAHDISDRKRIDQMKDNFISFVSHQLKAPITAIRWSVELIEEELGKISNPKVAAEIRDLLGQIKVVNDKDSKLVGDLLNVSRIDRGVIATEMGSTGLREIAELAAMNYHHLAETKGLKLTIREEKRDIVVRADRDKMAEAVGNAISNALKYTQKGGITLVLRAEKGYGVIDVTDTGSGMDGPTLRKIFTKDQVLGTNTQAENSSGLGLYIAKHFMQLQKGSIEVRSQLGKGTTFSYKVPLVKRT